MYVTTAEQRAGILVAVITGGRPRLRDRPTAGYLPGLKAAGVQDVVWTVSDADAPGYERDAHDLLIYPRAWAEEYAAAHWMKATPPGEFLGMFPGREWACREAERRGCWAVLELDDNVKELAFLTNQRAGKDLVRERGGAGLYVDLLGAVMLATNAWEVGPQLTAVAPTGRGSSQVARPGFPYSMILERVGPGREAWYGPTEDDITHALQYGSRADGATALVVPSLLYKKEHQSKTGMRKHYDNTRSVPLQRLFPQAVKLSVRMTHANGRGAPRIFHTMPPGAIRNPLIIRDQKLFGEVRDLLHGMSEEWYARQLAYNRAKVHRRAAQAARIPAPPRQVS